MMTPRVPADEAARIEALRSFCVLDTSAETDYDDLARLAAFVCGTPIALVSFVDPCRQWFKARHGIAATETHRDIAFCSHAILQTDLFVVVDTTADPRFQSNPLVTGEPHIRFYAGMPLATPDGFNLGTLCVIDVVPRTITEFQCDALRTLARQVMAQLLLRKKVEHLGQVVAEHETFRVLFEHSSDAHLIFDETDGIVDCNHAAVAMLGCASKSELLSLLPAALSPELQADGQRSLDKGPEMGAIARRSGYHRFDWMHRRMDGEVFPCEVTLTPVMLNERSMLLVVWHDLTERTRAGLELRESEERFRAFMDASPMGAFLKDVAGRYVYVNEPIARRFGKPASAWIGRSDETLFPGQDSASWCEHDREVLTGDHVVEFSESAQMPDGSISHWTSYKFPFRDSKGQLFVAGVAMDVTEKKKTEDAMRASEEKFRAVVDRLSEGVFLVDNETETIVQSNATLVSMLGYTSEELSGLTPSGLIANEDQATIDATIAATKLEVARTGRCNLGQRKYRRKDGSLVDVHIQIAFVPNGGAGLMSIIVRDITEQRAYEDRLFEYQLELEEANGRLKILAVTDGLTGIKNRAAFNERLVEEYDRATRFGHSLSVLLLDVDHFKQFNDTFGHPAGDDALRSVAASLTAATRHVDIVARYGGEEFAVILPDTDCNGAMVLAERCRRAIAGAKWDKRPVTVSVGVATLTPEIPDAEWLVQEADYALYYSKNAGRNRSFHNSRCSPPLSANGHLGVKNSSVANGSLTEASVNMNQRTPSK